MRQPYTRRKWPLALATLALAFLLAFPAAAQAALYVERLEWKAGDGVVSARGGGAGKDQLVILKDADSGQTLAKKEAEDDGRWELKAKPGYAPCRFVIVAGSRTLESGYTRNPPSSCPVQPPAASLTGLSVSGPGSVNEGAKATYKATASYDNGTKSDVTAAAAWTVTGPAAISGGVLTAGTVSSNQTAALTASFGGKSSTRTVTITNVSSTPAVTRLSVSGPGSVNEGVTATYKATATYYNGTKADVTATATWTVTGPATISGGVLTAGTVSSNQAARVTASYGGRTASRYVTIANVANAPVLTGLSVMGPASVNEGATGSFTATASYDNGTTSNVTATATWTVTGPATIAGGTLTAGSVTSSQTATVTAAFGGRTATRNVTIADVPVVPVLTGLSVMGPASVNEGATGSFTATAAYDNGTTSNVTATATWTVTGPATISGGTLTAGTVTSNQTATVTAAFGGRTATRNVTIADVPVVPVLTRVSVTGPASVNEGATATYVATAAYGDGTTKVVTGSAFWGVDNESIATVDASGVLTTAQVSADQVVNLVAAYTEGAVTLQGTLAVTVKNAAVVTGSHAGRFDSYAGSATCVACHSTETRDLHASVHYQWQGDASETVGLTSTRAGKLGGINDFCIYPDINWIGKLTNVDGQSVDGGCAKCHVGLGDKPEATATEAQLANMDCLLCHSAQYKRTVGQVGGVYKFVPDEANMTVSVLQAASDIILPGKDQCLNCHTKAGGGNNFKRGDIEEAHRNPTASFDVHMASTASGGAGLSCLDCHASSFHKIAGRGVDLRERDIPDEVSCAQCHTTAPHASSRTNQHTARVGCTTCHIPTFAKSAPTDMDRDWSAPGDLVVATGLYEPHHVKGTNVVPEYKFFNGISRFYQFGAPATAGANGRVVMAGPEGKVTDPGVKLLAFKHHLARQPQDPVTKNLLPLKIGKFFETGLIQQAAELGVAGVGWAYNGYQYAQTERYLGLFHEVAPATQALSCATCHYSGTRVDFAALGYTPNATYNNKPLCASCHGDKSGQWTGNALFDNVHSYHVDRRGYDCNRCHAFSRAQ